MNPWNEKNTAKQTTESAAKASSVSYCSTADGFLPVVFGSEGSVALCHACCIPQLLDPALAFDHMNGLSWMGWQGPPGTNSSLCGEVKNTVLLLWNLPSHWIRPWLVSDLWCLYCAFAENTNVQQAKHGEGKRPLHLSELAKQIDCGSAKPSICLLVVSAVPVPFRLHDSVL